MEEKGGGKVPIYRHGPHDLSRQIGLDRKSKVEIKQYDRRQASKRHSKEFEINSQDEGAIMGKRGTRALKGAIYRKMYLLPTHRVFSKIEVAVSEKIA